MATSAVQEIQGNGLLEAIETAALPAITNALWKWIDANPDREVFHIKFWIISKTFYVRDLLPFAELLLGKNPGAVTV